MKKDNLNLNEVKGFIGTKDSGLYRIYTIYIDDLVYIGRTKTYENKRFSSHIFDSKGNCDTSLHPVLVRLGIKTLADFYERCEVVTFIDYDQRDNSETEKNYIQMMEKISPEKLLNVLLRKKRPL